MDKNLYLQLVVISLASYRERRVSDDIDGQNVIEARVPGDQITSHTLTDCENATTKFGSPDSGYSVSPLNLVMVSKDAVWDGEPLGEQAGEILDETLSRSNVE
jgi:hypothetical protein